MESKKTIVYIGNELLSRGGTPTSIDTLAPKLGEEGFVVKTASGKKNKILRIYHMIWVVFSNRKKADYVLIDTYSTMNFWYAWIIAQLCQRFNLKYIPILHGGDLPKRLEKTPEESQAVFKKAHVNIAPSQYLKAEFESWGYTNIEYIPNSIEVENYSFKERTTFRPRLLWVRGFAKAYNPLLALEVFEILVTKYPEAALTMIGPEKDGCLEICKDYAAEKNLPVKFPGRLSREEWADLASDHDLFLNTSNVDNTPVSLLEAMALGLPVVSTGVGGIPFLIEGRKEGLLVPPNDPLKMADAVENLINNSEEASKMAFSARKKVEAFDWEMVKGKWISLLMGRS